MNKVKVRCWKAPHYRPELDRSIELIITYPEGNYGHSLITCLKCGAVFAVTVELEVYVGPPLEEKLLSVKCSNCTNVLGDNWAYYPETYLVEGKKYSFERTNIIPPDEESIVAEFDGIYES